MIPPDPYPAMAPPTVPRPGETGTGGWYTGAEHDAPARVLGEMPSWPSSCRRRHQEAFEAAFATCTGAAFAVRLNSAQQRRR